MIPMAVHSVTTLSSPDQASLVLAQAICAGDLEGASSCFARDACFVAPDGTQTSGRDQIRLLLGQMIAANTQIEVVAGSVLIAGEIALASEHWDIGFRDAHGTPFHQASPANMVLRRIGHDWSLVVAAPWGWGCYQLADTGPVPPRT